jgi:predicted hydrocarbon binding protein
VTLTSGERHKDMTLATSHRMSPALPHLPARTLTVPVEFFDHLRRTVLEAPGDAVPLSVDAVRDAGYAAGQALYDHFASWLAERGEAAPADLADARFPWLLHAFFHAMGWGRLELHDLSEAVVALDATDWGESGGPSGGCLVSTGLFAGFFGRLADAPIAVLEVEAQDAAPGSCRFLLGSVDVMRYVWERMERGIPYEHAAASV